jgi:hypothetical protein
MKTKGFWATMNRLAYEELAKREKISVAAARRRIIAEYARLAGVSFKTAARRTERPDGAR